MLERSEPSWQCRHPNLAASDQVHYPLDNTSQTKPAYNGFLSGLRRHNGFLPLYKHIVREQA